MGEDPGHSFGEVMGVGRGFFVFNTLFLRFWACCTKGTFFVGAEENIRARYRSPCWTRCPSYKCKLRTLKTVSSSGFVAKSVAVAINLVLVKQTYVPL